MDIPDISSYFGVPVLLQLKLPIAVPKVQEKQKLQHSLAPSLPQWIPMELMEVPPDGSSPIFVSVQMLRYAVLTEIDGSDMLEVRWLIPGTAPGTMTTVATLMKMADVAFITRVIDVGESSPLIIAKG